MATLKKLLTKKEKAEAERKNFPAIRLDVEIKHINIEELSALGFILTDYKNGFVSCQVLIKLLRRAVKKNIDVF